MKVAAVFVIYNPNIEELKTNILKIINHVDKVILWSNSYHENINIEGSEDKLVRMGNGENSYIAYPLNEALDYCLAHGYEFLLTMDQDSEWEDLHSFLSEVETIRDAETVIYAPNVNGERDQTKQSIELDNMITSGSLHNVAVTKELGGFREDYKIYWVDGEFSYWSRINGYKILCLPRHILSHQFGGSTKKVWGIHGANYSPIVYYFMFRNMLWMHREYGVKAVSYKTILYTCKLYIPGIILCETRKWSKLMHILKAFWEGMFTSIRRRAV